jgi:gliding motility-associated lipoprotein GldD
MKYFSAVIILLFFLTSCSGDVLPKPIAYLSLKYPENSYKKVTIDCPYNFEISDLANIQFQENCWAKIEYPQLKATIHITYRSVSDNLNEILKEVEKLTFEHTIKADAIPAPKEYENLEKSVYVYLYNIEGNVASNIQFRATDSLNHVLSGALYFNVKPNYDSIIPSIKYIEKDMMHLIETLEWN